ARSRTIDTMPEFRPTRSRLRSGRAGIGYRVSGIGGIRRVGLAVLFIMLMPALSAGYSVLTHEAIIDSMWERDITPVLLKRFPRTSPESLRVAHGYAYGGAIIQDMGYYP